MERLINMVTDYVGEKYALGTAWYDWRFDPGQVPPDLAGGRQCTNWHERNVDLKERLCQAWREGDVARRSALERYYIVVWGGVRANLPGTLERYHRASADENIARGRTGIASWSKALCVRDPLAYAIFDARVAASLNALQVIHRTPAAQAVRFPVLASRNATVIRGNQALSGHFRTHAWPRVNAGFYRDYLKVCAGAGTRLGAPDTPWPVYTVEMALFAQTEELLGKAFPGMA